MRNLVRTPLTWMVIAEFVIVGTLVAMAWNAVAHAAKPVAAAPAAAPAVTGTDESPSPLPELPSLTRPLAGLPPGLNLESAFWRSRLVQLNREQVYFEQLEWQIVHAAVLALERYVQGVVVPSIERAEGAKG